MLEVTPKITRAQKKRQAARLVENDNKKQPLQIEY